MLNYFMSISDYLPIALLIYVLLSTIGYFGVLKKMGINPWLALIPGVRIFFIYKKCQRIWHFVFLATVAAILGGLLIANGYSGARALFPSFLKNIFLLVIILCVYYIILYMFKRMAFGFGHDVGYIAGLLLLNPIFMLILGFSKDQFDEQLISLKGKELKQYVKEKRPLGAKILAVITSIVIVIGAIGYCGYVLFQEQMPGFIVHMSIDVFNEEKSEFVDGTHTVIYPEKDDSYQTEMRDLFFEDKSDVKDVVVYCYIVGSDLEDHMGLASFNISQMIEATRQGSNLKFVVEAGGSWRWFTDGIKYKSVGRYLIENGKLTVLEELDDKTCMAESESLEEFLTWANKKYDADRKMLVLWNHGGGIAGYGVDNLNVKDHPLNLLSVRDIVKALENSNSKFDMIDFDACLMQTIEVGYCLEPYCDYLFASEEVEPGQGQYYTVAFGNLAKDPTIPTEKVAATLCSCYDQYLANDKNGQSDASTTLSLVETRKIPAIYDLLIQWLNDECSKFATEKETLLDFLKAVGDTYHFNYPDHIDLIDFIQNVQMEESLKTQLVTMLNDAIVLRNKDSAEHIYGLSFYLPYQEISFYDTAYYSLMTMGLKEQTKIYNTIATIMANQKSTKTSQYGDSYDYSESVWYVKGFEDYNIELLYQDLPLNKTADGYAIELNEEQQAYVVDVQLAINVKVNKYWASLGEDSHFDYYDGTNYGLAFDNTWLTIDSIPVATHTISEQIGTNKCTYLSTVSAIYNFITPINIYVERTFYNDGKVDVKVLGYHTIEEEQTSSAKGYSQFKTGCLVTFTYDWYDENGNYIKTAMGHLPVVVRKNTLDAKQSNISDETFQFYGVITDATNRLNETERLTNQGK